MRNIFYPFFDGDYAPEKLIPNFFEKLQNRIQTGLFPKASKKRNQYKIIEQNENSLHFKSTSLLTGINIGINDVILNKSGNKIVFSVVYLTWARYCVYLCSTLAVVFIAILFLCPDFLFNQMYPRFNNESLNWIVFISLIFFFGVLWPWILIAFHKGPAKKCLILILEEINENK